MSWKDKIPGCFGDNDGLFAAHPMDERRAIEALLAAKTELVSFDDLLAGFRAHLGKITSNEEHIHEQMLVIREHYSAWF